MGERTDRCQSRRIREHMSNVDGVVAIHDLRVDDHQRDAVAVGTCDSGARSVSRMVLVPRWPSSKNVCTTVSRSAATFQLESVEHSRSEEDQHP